MCNNTKYITIICFLVLTGFCFAEIPLNIRGQMQTALWYSPETEFKSINYVFLYTTYNTEGVCKFNGRFTWKNQSQRQSFDVPFDKFLDPAISRSNIEISGPIYLNLPGYKITAGSTIFDFSPYIAQNNYDQAVGLRGYTITNLKLAGINFDGFYGWHAASFDKVGYGLKGQKRINNSMLTIIGTGTKEKRSGSSWSYVDQALSCEVNIRKRSGPINSMIACNKKNDNLSWIKKLSFTGMTRNFLQYELELFDFDKEFDPSYRNRQKEYTVLHAYNTIYHGINPLDKYKDRLGGKIRISGFIKNTPTKLEYQVFKLKSKDRFLNLFKLEQEHYFSNWYCKTALDFEMESMKTDEDKKASKLSIAAENKSSLALTPKIQLSVGTSESSSLDLEMLLGFTSKTYGLSLAGGFVRSNDIFQKTFLGDISSPLGLTVSFKISTPNIVEKNDFYYDKDGKLVWRDNYLLVKHSLFF